jgi:hypothetical protein
LPLSRDWLVWTLDQGKVHPDQAVRPELLGQQEKANQNVSVPVG